MYEIKHLSWFIQGAVREYLSESHRSERFLTYYPNVLSLVINYLEGRATLDGSCSDFECTIALDAKKIFCKPDVKEVFLVHGDNKEERIFSSYSEAEKYAERRQYKCISHNILLHSVDAAVKEDEEDKIVARSLALQKLTDEDLEVLGLTR